MRTRSSGPVAEPSSTPKRCQNKNGSKQQFDPTIVEKPVVMMDDTRTMEEMLQAPTEGYGDAIVIPTILADNFDLKHGLLNLITSKQFFSFEKDDPHAHICLSPDVVALTNAVKALLHKNTTPPPASIKAVEESCVTCGGPHSYTQCLTTDGNAFPRYHDNIQAYVSTAAVNYNQGNTGYQPGGELLLKNNTFSARLTHILVSLFMDSLNPRVVSAAKLPILNPNEFDLWKMRIEQYFLMTDYSLWEVILNGDSPVPTRLVEGVNTLSVFL
uniref:Ribonuclease H-like domain-containing protein n=1 Tax=Tanacetum cinerariifolium TaxID=118510 RepID=A0A6L2JWD1_TANCI|nr:ribonuclease H-like domain-containing protein [Tanacetum cinerariifolium]